MEGFLSTVQSRTAQTPTFLTPNLSTSTPQTRPNFLQPREGGTAPITTQPEGQLSLDTPAVNSYNKAVIERAEKIADDMAASQALITSQSIISKMHTIKYSGMEYKGKEFIDQYPDLVQQVKDVFDSELQSVSPSTRSKVIAHVLPQYNTTLEDLTKQKLQATDQFRQDGFEAGQRSAVNELTDPLVLFDTNRYQQTFQRLIDSAANAWGGVNTAKGQEEAYKYGSKLFKASIDAIKGIHAATLNNTALPYEQRAQAAQNQMAQIGIYADLVKPMGLGAEEYAHAQTALGEVLKHQQTVHDMQDTLTRRQMEDEDKRSMSLIATNFLQDAQHAKSQSELLNVVTGYTQLAQQQAMSNPERFGMHAMALVKDFQAYAAGADYDSPEGEQWMAQNFDRVKADPEMPKPPNLPIKLTTWMAFRNRAMEHNDREVNQYAESFEKSITPKIVTAYSDKDPMHGEQKRIVQDLRTRFTDTLIAAKKDGPLTVERAQKLQDALLSTVDTESWLYTNRKIVQDIKPDGTFVLSTVATDAPSITKQYENIQRLYDMLAPDTENRSLWQPKPTENQKALINETIQVLRHQMHILSIGGKPESTGSLKDVSKSFMGGK